MIEKKLYVLLSTDADLIAVVGSKVYPLAVPSEDENGDAIEAPYCVFFRFAPDELHYTNDGYSGLRTARFQIDCYHATYEGVVLLSRLVQKACNNWDQVQSAFVTPAPEKYEESTKLFHSIVEVKVMDLDDLGS